MITQALAHTEIADMIASLNNVMAGDPERFADPQHIAYVATNLAWLLGNKNGSAIQNRSIKDPTTALAIPVARTGLFSALQAWIDGKDVGGEPEPDGYLLANAVGGLAYTDAPQESGLFVVVAFATRAFQFVSAFILKDGQFVPHT